MNKRRKKSARVSRSAVVTPKSKGVSFGVANSFALCSVYKSIDLSLVLLKQQKKKPKKTMLVCLHMKIENKLTFYADCHHENHIGVIFNMRILINPFHRHYS